MQGSFCWYYHNTGYFPTACNCNVNFLHQPLPSPNYYLYSVSSHCIPQRVCEAISDDVRRRHKAAGDATPFVEGETRDNHGQRRERDLPVLHISARGDESRAGAKDRIRGKLGGRISSRRVSPCNTTTPQYSLSLSLISFITHV